MKFLCKECSFFCLEDIYIYIYIYIYYLYIYIYFVYTLYNGIIKVKPECSI